jgi:para-nitrobenzyl esterase
LHRTFVLNIGFMKKITSLLILSLQLLAVANAQQVIPLYEGKAAGSENWTWSEAETKDPSNDRVIYNVTTPTLTAYLPHPSIANGTAVIIAPGGAFHILSMDNEGIAVAKWLNSKGIAAFVLKYRLARIHTNDPFKEVMGKMSNFKKLDEDNATIVPLAMHDGLKAVKYVRTNAKTMNIDPNRIGFMGFSAGATVTMSVVYNGTDETRPNFVAPIYAYEKAIIGTTVPKIKTPIYIGVASDDQLGFVPHSISIYNKWLDAKQPTELHVYERGGHGFGMKKTNITTDAWTEQFALWLQMQGFMPAPNVAPLQSGENIAVVNTEAGKVRGSIHNNVFTYKGIPYATAKRFEAPKKPKSWIGIRSSMTYGGVAPLLDPTTSVNDEMEWFFHHDWGFPSEDCLNLNVWSPNIEDGKKRPVLFWIHGGGFTAGSSHELPSYDGENMAKKGDVIVVSINHRLNALGFLDMSAYGEKYKYAANNSFLDLRMALEWVKTNIGNFGGDPNNVTILGQSGGGGKVNTLMAMPSAKRLFHKAVNQSGSFKTASLDKATTQKVAAEVLKILKLEPNQADSLQNVPLALLLDAAKKASNSVLEQLKAAGKAPSMLGIWGPSVDGDLIPNEIMSKEAFQLSNPIPLLIGSTKNEFMASIQMSLAGAPPVTKDKALEIIQKQYGIKTDAYLEAVKKAYPKDTKPSDWIDIDTRFRSGTVFQANGKSAVAGSAPVYLYLFAWQSPVMDGKFKALHCLEIPFAFNNIARCEEMTGGTKEAYLLSEKMSQAWLNFAKTGNPNHAGLPKWEPYNEAKGVTMFFDNECTIQNHHDAAFLKITGQ